MRFRISLLLLTTFPALAAAATPCAPAPRAPGTPVNAPHAAFEAYVVAVQAVKDASSPFGAQLAKQALVEVVRSFHGPYSAGQQVETFTLVGTRSCGGMIEEGGHVMVVSESGGPFEIVEVFPKGAGVPPGPLSARALITDEPRHSRWPSLKNATLRGDVDARIAAELQGRARTSPREHYDIAINGGYAQVSWGKAFGGNDARHKVIFERVDTEWVEILRYEAPTPTPARSRPRRGKQRALWAEGSYLQAPGRRIGSVDVVMPPLKT
jgi:hypothetical protein